MTARAGAALADRLRLVFVTPGDRDPARTERVVAAALEGGVTTLLLRERQLPDAERGALYARLVRLAHEAGALAVVSRDVELARASGADGLHVGHGGPQRAAVRAALPDALCSRSAHWPLHADDGLCDWVTLSPFRATPRSLPRPRLSDEQVAAALERLGSVPLVALGGLTAGDVHELPEGVAGVAVLRALADAPDPRGAAAVLRSAIDSRLAFPREA